MGGVCLASGAVTAAAGSRLFCLTAPFWACAAVQIAALQAQLAAHARDSVSAAEAERQRLDLANLKAELDAVLGKEGEAVLATVGGYRLEGASINLFERIEGDYFTILGLPLVKLLAALRRYAPSERFT